MTRQRAKRLCTTRRTLAHSRECRCAHLEDWQAVIGVLREKALPYMLEHADRLEQQLEQHAPDQATVTLSLTDDVFLRSSNGARW